MALEKDFELLDDFLANRMNAEEKASFEKRLETDTQLQKELLHQQKLIEGIQAARRMELKNMLNNTPVPPAQFGEGALLKTASWILVAAAVATGLYLFFNQDKEIQDTAPAIADQHPASPKESITENSTVVQPSETTPEIAVTEAKKEVATDIAPANKTVKNSDKPQLDIFDPSEEASSTSKPDQPIASTPDKKQEEASIVVENITGSKNHTFHYQFLDGKLLLYGSFDRNLFEIMEFFSDNKRTMFLYYKDNYYLLSEENDHIRALTPIHDANLLKKLRASREN
ncbi:MAG: hypothetical protein JNM57_05195 [Cyclobacteriaceae bacterium]|nr:hypothetical protein [Cyclobacteriaceae bacterium]